MLHEALLLPVLVYGSETIIWRKKERSRTRSVQKVNLRDLLCIRRMDRVLNARIRELCRVEKGWMKILTKVPSDGSAIFKE